ncbi:aspartate aminotransferase [Cladorrhinum sp. PSN259]|nr:aspartate aminotransferase [Cladorrhinum sp. PSN259]
MKSITEFKIEQWIDDNMPKTKVWLGGSTVGILSLSQLKDLAPKAAANTNDDLPPLIDPDLALSYGTPAGSLRLRERIAQLHSSPDTGVRLTADNVIITPGSIMANYLVLSTLAGPGDHVICQHPTFTQLWEIPKIQGAELTLWRMKPENDWKVDLDDLKTLIRPNTKAIIINNPNNPTGSVIPTSTLKSLIAIASTNKITLFSDEVFSPLFHSSTQTVSPLVSLLPPYYPHAISTGSLSKSFSLPGIRIGWVVSPSTTLLRNITRAHQYTTISVSRIDDGVAAFALSPEVYPALVERNLKICRANIDVVREFVERNSGRKKRVEWVEPKGASTAWVRILDGNGKPVDDKKFCEELVSETGVCFLPGAHCFGNGEGDLKGYVRIVIGVEDPEVLRNGLKVLEGFLNKVTQHQRMSAKSKI